MQEVYSTNKVCILIVLLHSPRSLNFVRKTPWEMGHLFAAYQFNTVPKKQRAPYTERHRLVKRHRLSRKIHAPSSLQILCRLKYLVAADKDNYAVFKSVFSEPS